MKKFYSIISAALIALSMTACNEVRGNVNENGNNIGTNSIGKSDLSAKPNSDNISENDIEAVKNTYNSEYEIVYDEKIIDLDFDGKNELLLLVGKANTKEFDVWTKHGNEMIRESSFGTGKVNFIDKIELQNSEIDDENVYLFSFSFDDGGTMKADEVLSVIKKTAGGAEYEVEHLLSRGTITYSDIAEPFAKDFYRKGWSKYDIGLDKDFGDITQEEYDRLYKEYTGVMLSDQSSKLSENQGSKKELTIPVDEVMQLLKPLKEYGDLCWKMFPYDLNKELVDMEQTISAERPTSAGTMTRTFYKVVNGDIKTEEQFIAKIDTILTEKAKKEFLVDPERNFEFSDGNLYISGRGAGGMGTGMDALYLDSVEYTDENTIVITVISFGDKNNWGTSENIKDIAKATLVKTDEGFRIDTCDYRAIIDFYFYNEIICNDKTIQL